MLTFKHFCDRHHWAAVAGYEFTLMDCLSFSAIRYGAIWGLFINFWRDILDCQVRDIPVELFYAVLVTILLIIYPLCFWVFGVGIYIRCKLHVRKFKGKHIEIVKRNLETWKADCDRRCNGKGK